TVEQHLGPAANEGVERPRRAIDDQEIYFGRQRRQIVPAVRPVRRIRDQRSMTERLREAVLGQPTGGGLDEIAMLVKAGEPPVAIQFERLGEDQRRGAAAELDHFARPQLLYRSDHAPEKIGIGLPASEVGQSIVRQAEPVEQGMLVGQFAAPQASCQPWPLDRSPSHREKLFRKGTGRAAIVERKERRLFTRGHWGSNLRATARFPYRLAAQSANGSRTRIVSSRSGLC